ncbi:probable galacturonosyltransferase 7 isoform X2 [Tanacetum coccineum]
MSDNIPFEIQMEIIKKVSHVKSLIRFRSVSKSWKSFIDSSEFINEYGARHTQPRSRIISLSGCPYEVRYIVDYDMKTFMVKHEYAPSVVASPLLKQYCVTKFVGACHGLLCFHSHHNICWNKKMLIIWNPFIGKSFGIALPSFYSQSRAYFWNPLFAFGVCPNTRDPTVVKILCADNMPWHVEVFTLSSGVWNVIPSGNLPRQSIQLNSYSTQVVIDRFIYWGACEKTFVNDDELIKNHMVVSFDLVTKEFKVVDLPDTLTNKFVLYVSVSKLRGSLVVSGYIKAEEARCCGVWVMERDSSFRKLFSIGASIYNILGFRENGEPIFETPKADGQQWATLDVYDPSSQQIKNLEYPGYSGKAGSFVMGSYKESLLLLDHPDLQIYCDDI